MINNFGMMGSNLNRMVNSRKRRPSPTLKTTLPDWAKKSHGGELCLDCASYLFDQNTKTLQAIDKEKFAITLNKYARINDLFAYYKDEIDNKTDMQKVFLNANYQETIKRMHFNKVYDGIYTYGCQGSIGLVVAVNTRKETVEKTLGII